MMLKAINTKILLAILATLTAIGALLVHNSRVNAKAAADAAKAAAILQEQQKATDAQKKEDAEFWKKVEQKKKRSKAYAGDGSKTNSYVP
jgi:hypothetical protein